VEVRPAVPWHKGKAISKLQSAYPQATLPVFFGDDLTDEDGFAAVQDVAGMAVFVGPARTPTCALYRVDSPQEVTETLRLIEQL
jgi:trehalose-phosphatase